MMHQVNESRKQRFSELDVIRLFALFLLVGLHFLLYTGFYDASPSGLAYYPVLCLRIYTSTTIPLFLMLSGYLLGERKPRKGWWKSLSRTLLIYVLCCIPCYFLRRYMDTAYMPSVGGIFWSIMGFELNPYSWYIDLYIGLFLLSPFLNRMHQGLSPEWHRKLVLILFLLISLPSLLNQFQWFNRSFWQHPGSVDVANQIIPNYWTQLPYALLYYEMGIYVRYHPPKIRARSLLLLLAGTLAFFTGFTAWWQEGNPFQTYPWVDYGGLAPALLTPLTFCFLSRVSRSRIRKEKTINLLARLSNLCLGAYLLSYCADMMVYSLFGFSARFSSFSERLYCFPVVVPVIMLLSLILSAFVTIPTNWFVHWVRQRKKQR